ncbi:DMT family transporter [Lichenifustis flavocetrariae]|uniref:DMT family transporter n=1 Tax=Lichenifustis flavocetrariae TaxID=2949735 RepID=A0AA41Z3N6_9HYPH|nr:DMT family transporter [Lichenifustis flavocetrariae]MCW6508682.1 DMT family transporter [Lichenifustis flavocetrariae]
MSSLAITRPTGSVMPVAALVLGAIAMGLSPIAVRLADVGPFTSAFWRVFLALPVLWLWMRASEGRPANPPRPFSRPTILAGLAFAGDLFFWHLSIVHTSVANATFFATSAPLWVVLFGWLLFRERVSVAVLLGLGLCLLGGASLVWQSLQLAPEHVSGDAYGIITGVFFGLYFLAVRAARGSVGAARVTFEISVITAAVLAVAAIGFEHQLLPRSAAGWGALLSLALVSQAGGQGLLSYALGLLPTVFSSLVIFLEAVAAALAALLILGEPVSTLQVLGGLLIVAGIWVARPRQAAVVVEP